MSFTQEQLDALEAAIAEGTLTVKYADKEVTYRSLDELLRIRNLISRSLGGNKPKVWYPSVKVE